MPSLRVYSFGVEWYILTCGMAICLTLSIGCIIIQSRSVKWYNTTRIGGGGGGISSHNNNNKYNDNNKLQQRTLFFLYMVYIMACICSIQCFLCHISDNFKNEYYCEWGMPFCVSFYVAAKSFLYGFFLERAKATQKRLIHVVKNNDNNNNNNIYYGEVIFDYILPIYIFIYFWIFFILCMIYFRGKVFTNFDINNDNNFTQHRIKITGCLFYEFKPWLFILGALIDVINSIGLLYLFLKPLYQTIKTHEKYLNGTMNMNININIKRKCINHQHLKTNSEHLNFNEMVENEIINSEMQEIGDFQQEKEDLYQMITTIKINLLCTMLSTTSCIAFFLLMAFSKNLGIEQYLWFLGNIDLMINSLATFSMLTPNRSYVSEIIFCGCFNWNCVKFINCKCKIIQNVIIKLSLNTNNNNHNNINKIHHTSNHQNHIEHSAASTDRLTVNQHQEDNLNDDV